MRNTTAFPHNRAPHTPHVRQRDDGPRGGVVCFFSFLLESAALNWPDDGKKKRPAVSKITSGNAPSFRFAPPPCAEMCVCARLCLRSCRFFGPPRKDRDVCAEFVTCSTPCAYGRPRFVRRCQVGCSFLLRGHFFSFFFRKHALIMVDFRALHRESFCSARLAKQRFRLVHEKTHDSQIGFYQRCLR